jgi:plastocyanin
LLVLLAACERVLPGGDTGPRVLALTHDTIRLGAGVGLHEIVVRRERAGEFHPPHTTAREGDVIRFTAGDGGGHAIVFGEAGMEPATRDFLAATGQLRSPPLIHAGNSWVLSLDGAPAGEYRFHCTTHNAAGRLTVDPR